MTYRVYITDIAHSELEATVTASPKVAACAYKELLDREDLLDRPLVAVMERDGKQLYASKYDALPGRGRLHPWAPIDPFAAIAEAMRLCSWMPAVVS